MKISIAIAAIIIATTSAEAWVEPSELTVEVTCCVAKESDHNHNRLTSNACEILKCGPRGLPMYRFATFTVVNSGARSIASTLWRCDYFSTRRLRPFTDFVEIGSVGPRETATFDVLANDKWQVDDPPPVCKLVSANIYK